MKDQEWTCSAGHPNLKIDKFCISIPRCFTGDGAVSRQGHEYVANPYDESRYPECVCTECDPDQEYRLFQCQQCEQMFDRVEGHDTTNDDECIKRVLICTEEVHTDDECDLNAEHANYDYSYDRPVEMKMSHEFIPECIGCQEDHEQWLLDTNEDPDHDCPICKFMGYRDDYSPYFEKFGN